MKTIIWQAVAATFSTAIISIVGTWQGWDNTAVWVVVMNGFIILVPQIIVRGITYKERSTASALIIEEAARMAIDKLQGEIKRVDREIQKLNKLSGRLDSVYANEFQQIKEEIVRLGGCMLPIFVSPSGATGEVTGSARLQVIQPKTKWRTIKRKTEKAWNGVRRSLE